MVYDVGLLEGGIFISFASSPRPRLNHTVKLTNSRDFREKRDGVTFAE
jgi:hypothetical protein